MPFYSETHTYLGYYSHNVFAIVRISLLYVFVVFGNLLIILIRTLYSTHWGRLFASIFLTKEITQFSQYSPALFLVVARVR